MATRAVLFDLGGTLFSYATTAPHFGALLQRVASQHGISAPAEELQAHYREVMREVGPTFQGQPYFLHRELFRQGFGGLLGRYGAAVDADLDAMYEGQIAVGVEHARLREGVPETLRALRDRGLHLGIVSNIDDDQFDALWPGLGISDLFDATTTSEQARSCKPDRGIYDTALAKAGAPDPVDVVFVGDSPPHDMAGANPLGMTSVLISKREADWPSHQRPHHVIRAFPELLEVLA